MATPRVFVWIISEGDFLRASNVSFLLIFTNFESGPENQKKDLDWQFLVCEEAAGSRAVYFVSATMQLSLSHLHLEENSG